MVLHPCRNCGLLVPDNTVECGNCLALQPAHALAFGRGLALGLLIGSPLIALLAFLCVSTWLPR